MGIKHVASESLGVIVIRAIPFPPLDSQIYETRLWEKNHDILDTCLEIYCIPEDIALALQGIVA